MPNPADISTAQRLLVILPTWVGDFVMATPTLRALRRRFQNARITFLTVPNLVDLIDGGDWMDDVLTWPARSARNKPIELLSLARRLRAQRFDCAVLLPNSFRAAAMSWLTAARKRVGYDRDGRGLLLTDRIPVPRTNGHLEPHPICAYYARIAERLGCPTPGDDLELSTTPQCDESVDRRMRQLGLADRRPFVIVSPGASFGAAKLWLPERFAAVADRLIESRGAAVAVTCGPGEESLARRIADLARHPLHVFDAPRLSLGELKSLVKRSDLLIGNDTGPRHIAKAFNIAVVTVFGPTHQAWTDTRYPLERKVSIPVDCGPCQQKVCPLGHLKCMTGVSFEMVYDRCIELLDHSPALVADAAHCHAQ